MHAGGSGRRRSRVIALGVALVAASGVVAGCTAAPGAPSSTAAPEEPAFDSGYVAPDPIDLAPLTGEPVAAGSLTTPSIAAKIDNHPAARPQVGLNRTDIVFEELVEGGLTRYVAVWHSDVPGEIGPVRSIRPMDPDIISPLGGIVAYSGGQERFVDLMRGTPVYNAIHGQADTEATFFRSPSKPSPHNVLVKAPDVIAQHGGLGAPRQHFAFAADAAGATAVRDGAPVAEAALVFGSAATPSWVWSAEQSAWLRAQAGVPDLDEAGAQLGAVNVVIVQVPISTGLGVPKTELIGSGAAWVISGGKKVDGTWSKPDAASPIRLVDATGTSVRLAPGNTWVELVPVDGSVAFR